MIAVEYYDDGTTTKDNEEDAHRTFEIFSKLEDAWEFARNNKKFFYSMWIADFNVNRIFIEDESWNYEDCSDLYSEIYIICESLL